MLRLSTAAQRPKSAVSQAYAFLSFVGLAAVLGAFRWFESRDVVSCFILIVLALALPHVWTSHVAERTVFSREKNDKEALDRILRKLAGLAFIYALIAVAYFGFQGFYQSFVVPLVAIFERIWLPLLILAPVYVWLTDRLMDDPEDGLYQVGLAVTGRFESVNRPQALQYLLGWCVKAFFIPLMASYMLNDIRWFLSSGWPVELRQPGGYYPVIYRAMFFIDVTFAATGYLLALRLIDTHIRSTEPTMLGWVVCVICYEPFWPLFARDFFPYEDGYYWDNWLAGQPLALIAWSGLILVSIAVYVWATITFGVRFSNLTNRGILTNGPYRWMKHPAYVSKNLAFWLISVPFLTNQSPEIAVRSCLLLLGIGVIYLLRAITEENHLMRDPAYQEYSAWMRNHSLWAMFVKGQRRLFQKV